MENDQFAWRWHATARSGRCCAAEAGRFYTTGMARGQRVWKLHPDGGLSVLGTSPDMTARGRRASTSGSATGTAAISASVIRVQRAAIEIIAIRDLHDAPEIHHGDAGRDVPHHGQIVGDEQVAKAQALLQIHEQVDDLSLDRNVEGGYRLVAISRLGSSAIARAMPMRWRWPPEKLVRIAVGHIGQQARLRRSVAATFVRGCCLVAVPGRARPKALRRYFRMVMRGLSEP